MAQMQGRIVTNEKTGAKAWWDGKTLTPVQIAPGTNMEGLDQGQQSFTTQPSPETAGLPPPPDVAPPPPDPRQTAVGEAQQFNQKMLRAIGVPLAQAGLAYATGGMSIPAQMAIGGGAELLAQKTGMAPESNVQLGLAAAAPGLGPVVSKGIDLARKAGRGIVTTASRFAAPNAFRTGGVESAVEQLGGEPDVIKRVLSPKPSTTAFNAVKSEFQDVPTNKITRGITSALNEIPASAKSDAASDYLKGLHDILDQKGNMPYEQIANEIQGMRTQAKQFLANKDFAGHAAVMKARSKIIAEMDALSPALKEANAITRRMHNVDKIEDALTMARSDVAFKKLLKKDALLSSMPEEDLRLVETIANKLTTVGTQASPFSNAGGRLMNLAVRPLAAAFESPQGRSLIRKMFKEGQPTSPAAMSAIMQYGRAVLGQMEKEPDGNN